MLMFQYLLNIDNKAKAETLFLEHNSDLKDYQMYICI